MQNNTNIIPADMRIKLQHRFNFYILQGGAILLFYLLQSIGAQPAMLMIVMGIWNALAYSWLFYKELVCFQFVYPMMGFFLVCIVRGGLATVYLGLCMTNDVDIVFGLNSIIESNICMGEIVLLLEEYLLTSSYFLYMGKEEKKEFFRKDYPYRKCGLIVFSLCIILIALDNSYPVIRIHSILGSFVRVGGFSILFLLLADIQVNKTSTKGYLLVFVILFIYIPLNALLFQGAKAMLVQLVIPFFIFSLTKIRNFFQLITFSRFLFVLLSLVFIVFFVFPFTSFLRAHSDEGNVNEIAWKETQDLHTSLLEGDTSFFALDGNAWQYLRRNSFAKEGAWAYEYKNHHGLYGSFFYKTAARSLIPRFIDPNKPDVHHGALISVLLGYGYDTNSVTTQTALGLGGSALFSLGWIGLIIVCVFNGLIQGFFWTFIRSHLFQNFWFFFAYAVLLFKTMGHFEDFFDGGMAYYAMFSCYYLIPAYFIMKTQLRKEKNENSVLGK